MIDLTPQQKDGYVDLAWAMLEQAAQDLAALCRYGLITPSGRCMPWPRATRLNKDGTLQREFISVAHMRGPSDHRELKQFFLDPRLGQYVADLVGWRQPMNESWADALKHNCGRQP